MKVKFLTCDEERWVEREVVRVEVGIDPELPSPGGVFFNCYDPAGRMFVITSPENIEYIMVD